MVMALKQDLFVILSDLVSGIFLMMEKNNFPGPVNLEIHQKSQ